MGDEVNFIDRSSTTSLNSHYELEEPDIIFPLPSIRTLHEKDQQCANCKCNFDTVGLAHNQKKVCKFCYRGICARELQYEYYHSETKRAEKMCPLCHHKIIAMSEEFGNELKSARLERIQLRQEIKLAIKQKEELVEERKKCEMELENAKKNLTLSLDEIDEILINLQQENKIFEQSHSELQAKSIDCDMNLNLMKSRFLNLKKIIEELNATHSSEIIVINKLKEEFNELQITKLGLMKSEETLYHNSSEMIETLIEEINELKDELNELKERNKNMNEILHESEEEYNKKESTIEDIKASLSERKNSVIIHDSLSNEELKKLEELRQQLNETTSIAQILTNRLNLLKAKQPKQSIQSDTSSLYIKNSELNGYDSSCGTSTKTDKIKARDRLGKRQYCDKCIIN